MGVDSFVDAEMQTLKHICPVREILIASLLMALAGAVDSFGQGNMYDDGEAILTQLVEQKMPAPQLGWILPNGDLITEVNSGSVTILADLIEIRVSQQTEAIPAEKVLEFIRKTQVDCDQLKGGTLVPLYRYDAMFPPTDHITQAFVFPGDESGHIHTGFLEYKPSVESAEAIWAAMKSNPRLDRLLRAATMPDGSFIYSYATQYDEQGRLMRRGRFLQDTTGKILGQSIEEINPTEVCNGCIASTYDEDLVHGNPQILNLVTVPGIANPIALEYSSSADARAIEFFTFSASGRPATFRQYEYTRPCTEASLPKEPPPPAEKPDPADKSAAPDPQR